MAKDIATYWGRWVSLAIGIVTLFGYVVSISWNQGRVIEKLDNVCAEVADVKSNQRVQIQALSALLVTQGTSETNQKNIKDMQLKVIERLDKNDITLNMVNQRLSRLEYRAGIAFVWTNNILEASELPTHAIGDGMGFRSQHFD